MADIYFVGTIDHAAVDFDVVSSTWAIVPGNSAWSLREGIICGETQTSLQAVDGRLTFNHPIDAQFESLSSEGWPFFVCEVWDKSNLLRNFIGCGCVWLPATPGLHVLDVHLWRPVSGGFDGLIEQWLPNCPDLRSLRELIVRPYLRSTIETDSVGMLRLSINIIHSGLTNNGVITANGKAQ